MRFIILLSLVLITNTLADNIYLNNGSVINNVKIIKHDSVKTLIMTSRGDTLKLASQSISNITQTPFKPNNITSMTSNNPVRQTSGKQTDYQKAYSNLKLLPVSILAFAVSYDYFKDASLLDDQTKSGDTPEINKQIKRKRIIGSLALITGVLNTVISLAPNKKSD